MNFEVIRTVQELTNKYGSEIYTDSRKLKSYLNDFYPDQHVRDKRLLCDSIDQKIPVEIMNYAGYEIEQFHYANLVTRLYDNLGISQDLAEETVDTWINILGKSHLKGASINNNTGNSNPYHQQSRPGTALNYTPVDSNTVFMNNPPNIPNSAIGPRFSNKKIIAAVAIIVLLIASVGVGFAASYNKKDSQAKVTTEAGNQPKQSTEVKQVEQKKEEATKEAKVPEIVLIQSLITNYEKAKMNAINKNNFAEIEPYLITNSSIYKQDKSDVDTASMDNGKQQILLNYKIKDIRRSGDNYSVTMEEKYTVFSYGNPTETEYNSTYFVVNSNDKWLLNDRDSRAVGNKNTQQSGGNVKADTYYVEYSVNNYLYQMVRAINNINFSMVEPYLVPGSQLYNAQKKLIVDLNKQNIQERLLEYEITSMEPIAEGYKVKTYEKYLIDYNGDQKTKDFNSTYIVRYVGGSWALSDMLN